MNVFSKIRSWLRPSSDDPEAEAESQRIRWEQETIKTSQAGSSARFGPGAGSTSLPPTPDVLDPPD